MSGAANAVRGEARIEMAGMSCIVRPSFAALVAAEAETGSLLALAERAGAGAIALGEIEALLWHCLARAPDGMDRAGFGEALLAGGVGAVMPALRTIFRQILAGGS